MKRKAIKKTAIIAVIILIFAFMIYNPTETVKAENGDNYLRIITDTTPFYQDKEGYNLLFYLPYTYYVKVISSENGMTHAEIGSNGFIKIDGYIPTEMLLDDKKEVVNPYPIVTITSAKNTTFYEDAELTRPISYIFSGRNMTYYGNGTSKELSYYVSFNGKLGYVKESDLMPFSIPNHPNPMFEEKEEITERREDSQSLTVLRILIIASLGLAGIIGLIFSLRKKPTVSTASTYYDEENEE